MSAGLQNAWSFLTTSPLAWLTATLLAYQAGHWLWRKAKLNPLVNPVLIAMGILSGLLLACGTDYRIYYEGTRPIHFLLGPATVALAVPLYKQLDRLLRSLGALTAGLLAGSVAAAVSAIGIGQLFGASHQTLMSLAPKSATSPIAMGVAEAIGGLPSLTAVIVILTGISGAVTGAWVLDLCRIRDERARGLALGTAAHGIGTARALQMGEVTGAFSGLAMGLNGVATAVLVPFLVRWMMG